MTLGSTVSCGLEVQGQGPGLSWVRRGGTRVRAGGRRADLPKCRVRGRSPRPVPALISHLFPAVGAGHGELGERWWAGFGK